MDLPRFGGQVGHAASADTRCRRSYSTGLKYANVRVRALPVVEDFDPFKQLLLRLPRDLKSTSWTNSFLRPAKKRSATALSHELLPLGDLQRDNADGTIFSPRLARSTHVRSSDSPTQSEHGGRGS